MPYALFEDGEKLSRAFPTEKEVLEHADRAGLVDDDGLQDHLEIRSCPEDKQEAVDPKVDDWELRKV